MPQRSAVTLHVEHARLRVLLRALSKMFGDEQRQFRPKDLARMRALLFRIRLEIVPEGLGGAGVPGVRSGTAPDALSASAIPCGDAPASEHLQDLGDALTAFEVLGEDFERPLRLRAQLFVEWLLARMERVEREGQAMADATSEPHATRFPRFREAAPAQPCARFCEPGSAGAAGRVREGAGRTAAVAGKADLARPAAVMG